MNDETNARVINFVRAHTVEAGLLAHSTGLNADLILALSAYESGYGTNRPMPLLDGRIVHDSYNSNYILDHWSVCFYR
jgi:hypothetical protein